MLKRRYSYSLFAFVACLLTTAAHSRKTSFKDKHRGLMFGGGTYLAAKGYDPIPDMLAEGSTANGTDSYSLVPLKVGGFVELTALNVELYLRILTNSQQAWTTSGVVAGSGKTNFRSWGAGLNFGHSLAQTERLKLNLVLGAELVNQRATIRFTENTNDVEQSLSIASTSFLFGGGLQPELWLGDMWVASILVMYHHDLGGQWKATQSDSVLNRSWNKGVLESPTSGKAVESDFGGLLFELSMKLNF